MKNRIIGLILCVALLASGFAAHLFVHPEKLRVHQHLEAVENTE